MAYDLLERVSIGRDQRLDVYAACVFCRLVETSNALVLLGARGFNQDAASLVRVALEALLKLGAVCEQPSFASEVIAADSTEQLKLLNLVIEGKAGNSEGQDIGILEARKKDLEDLKKQHGVRRISTEEIACKAGMEGLYQNVYRLTSSYVHLSPRALDEYLRIEPDGKIVEICHGPSDRQLKAHVLTATDFLRLGLQLLSRRLGLDLPQEFEEFSSHLQGQVAGLLQTDSDVEPGT